MSRLEMDPEQLIDGVVEAAREAGRLIEGVRKTAHLDVSEKGDQGPVTRADRASDGFLRTALTQLHPAGWLSEETADDPARLSGELLWVVDPLDGTKEFIEGVPQYSVAIGLVANGEPLLGVVHVPSTGDSYAAVRGAGATRNGVRITVADGPRLLASRSEMKRGEFDDFADWELDPVGSIALKLGMIAGGIAAATISRGPKLEWDVCAGSIIVTEAGGAVSDVFGEPLRFNQEYPKSKGVVAGAPAAHARLIARVREVGVSDRMTENWR